MSTLIGVVALAFLVLLVASGLAGASILISHLRRTAARTDPYEPAAAEAPSDAAYADVRRMFGPPVVDGGHARCGGPCCAAEHIDDLMAEFDWHAAEHEMRRTR